MTPIVLYLGPSMLDGAPIVVLATLASSNVKTGSMVQTWIMRGDIPPHTAGHAGKDASICGQCPRRHSLKDTGASADCYVTIHQAPLSTWKAWDRAGRPGENWTDERAILGLQRDAGSAGLRLGSYGDPAAVPHTVWSDLIEAIDPSRVVGYTHQWRTLESATDCGIGDHVRAVPYSNFAQRDWYRDHVMASCDTLQDASYARSLGWRYFLAIGPEVSVESVPDGLAWPRTIECPATTVAARTCATCGACDGAARGVTKASIYLREHGPLSSAKAKRARALTVIK